MTRSEAETKRQKAVEFLRRIGDDEAADKFEAMDAGEYAAHKGADLRDNPTRRLIDMRGTKNKSKMQAELDAANDYIEELEAKLDDIAGIASGDEEEADDSDDDEDDE